MEVEGGKGVGFPKHSGKRLRMSIVGAVVCRAKERGRPEVTGIGVEGNPLKQRRAINLTREQLMNEGNVSEIPPLPQGLQINQQQAVFVRGKIQTVRPGKLT